MSALGHKQTLKTRNLRKSEKWDLRFGEKALGKSRGYV